MPAVRSEVGAAGGEPRPLPPVPITILEQAKEEGARRMTEPKGKTYRKAFITVHAFNGPTSKPVSSEAEAKKIAARKPMPGPASLIAVDAIRAVIDATVLNGAVYFDKAIKGGRLSGSVPLPPRPCSWIRIVGQNQNFRTHETVEEIRALIDAALKGAEIK